MNIEIVALIALLFGILLTISPIVVSIFTLLVSSLSGKYGYGNKTAFWANVYIILYALGVGILAFLIYQIINKSSDEYLHGWVILGLGLSTAIGLYWVRYYFLKPKKSKIFKEYKHQIKKSVTTNKPLVSVLRTSSLSVFVSIPTLGLFMIMFSSISVISAMDYLIWLLALIAGILAVLYFCLFHISSANGLTGLLFWLDKHKNSAFTYLGLSLVLMGWVSVYILLSGVSP
jgi:MFS family permease